MEDFKEKTIITFGSAHHHTINEKYINHQCAGIINCKSYIEGRKIAFELFGPYFCTTYFEEDWNPGDIKYYPRGYIELN